MWVQQISIDGFGIYVDETVDLGPGLTVFFGENEAGKTTLLAFIRYVLFGFPKGAHRLNKYEPVRKAKHGGSLRVQTSRGQVCTLERHKTLTVMPPRITEKELLGGATSDLFRNVYAFTLGELQNLKSLEDDKVKAVLYGAAMGTAIEALPKAKVKFETRAKELLSQAPKPLHYKREELEAKRKALLERQETVGEYDAVERQLQELTLELERLQAAQHEARDRLGRIDLTLRLWPTWDRLQKCEGQLTGLPDRPFPESGLSRLESLRSLLTQRREQWEDAERRRDGVRQELAMAEPDERLLSREHDIEAVLQRRGLAEEARTLLPQVEKKVAVGEERLQQSLVLLPAGWDAAMLREASDLPAWRGEATELGAAFSARRAIVEQKGSLVQDLEAQVETRRRALSVAEVERDGIGLVDLPPEAYVTEIQKVLGRYKSEAATRGALSDGVQKESADLRSALVETCPSWHEPESVLRSFDFAPAEELLAPARDALALCRHAQMEAQAALLAAPPPQEPLPEEEERARRLRDAGWPVFQEIEALPEGTDIHRLWDEMGRAAAAREVADAAVPPLEAALAEARQQEEDTMRRLQETPDAGAELPPADTLQLLRNGWGRFEADRETRAAIAQQLAEAEQQIRQGLDGHPPGWLEALPVETLLEKAAGCEHRLAEHERDLTARRAVLEENHAALQIAQRGLERAQAELDSVNLPPDVGTSGLQARSEELKSLQLRLSELESAETNVSHLSELESQAQRAVDAQRQSGMAKAGAVLLYLGLGFLVAGLVAGGTLVAVHGVGTGLGIGGGLALIGIILAAVYRAQAAAREREAGDGLRRLDQDRRGHKARRVEAARRHASVAEVVAASARRLQFATPPQRCRSGAGPGDCPIPGALAGGTLAPGGGGPSPEDSGELQATDGVEPGRRDRAGLHPAPGDPGGGARGPGGPRPACGTDRGRGTPAPGPAPAASGKVPGPGLGPCPPRYGRCFSGRLSPPRCGRGPVRPGA